MPLPYPFDHLPVALSDLLLLGPWAWAAPIAACLERGIVSSGDITDAIFFVRHPERGGKKLGANEQKLINEWKSIQADVAAVLDAIRRPAPAPFGSGPPWHRYARAELVRWGGITDSSTRIDEQYFQAAPYFGGKSHADGYAPKSRLAWCAAFVNWCLHRSGHSHPGSGSNGSFLKSHLWEFDALEEPREGCIIVMGHGLTGTNSDHVALLASWLHLPTGRNVADVVVEGAKRLTLLGGNQSSTVMEKPYYGVKLFAARGKNGVTSPYLWPRKGGTGCKIRSVPSDGSHACGLNPE